MKERTYIIDRIEGDYVVCEISDGSMINIKSNRINEDFKEGDVLLEDEGFFKISEELTKERREKIEDIVKNIWQ